MITQLEIDQKVKEQNDTFYRLLRQKLDNAIVAERVARDRLQFLKDLGESPIELETNLSTVQNRRKRLESALEKRGYV